MNIRMCSRRIMLTDDTVYLHLAQAISCEESMQVTATSPLLNLQKINWLQIQEDITFHVTVSIVKNVDTILGKAHTIPYLANMFDIPVRGVLCEFKFRFDTHL